MAWYCEACGFENIDPASKQCELCNAERVEPREVLPAEAEDDPEWAPAPAPEESFEEEEEPFEEEEPAPSPEEEEAPPPEDASPPEEEEEAAAVVPAPTFDEDDDPARDEPSITPVETLETATPVESLEGTPRKQDDFEDDGQEPAKTPAKEDDFFDARDDHSAESSLPSLTAETAPSLGSPAASPASPSLPLAPPPRSTKKAASEEVIVYKTPKGAAILGENNLNNNSNNNKSNNAGTTTTTSSTTRKKKSYGATPTTMSTSSSTSKKAVPPRSIVSSFSVASEQGRRKNMEDVYMVNGSIQDDPSKSYFAVFDGHAGSRAAEYCGQRMLDNVTSTAAWRRGNAKEAMRYGIQRTEQAYLRAALAASPKWFDGTTAVACVIIERQATIGWVGDSRAVLGRYATAEGWTSVSLSLDHKPTQPSERERIIASGGNIGRSVKEANARNVRAVAGARCPVFCFGAHPAAPMRCYPGGLSLSRSIGDVTLKYHSIKCVIGDPDVEQAEINLDTDRFLILGCDGIWDVLSNDAAVAIVANAHAKKQDAAKALVRAALQSGSTDNMTVVVVKFVNNHHHHHRYASAAAAKTPPLASSSSENVSPE